ncbi:hypothetical protein FRX31_002413 [Thalictrum thalictroides]|uniref:Reverse transcriptase n=1 Tax=Thalictrum thalictroides TaxID=46969 RepID=A0A7J6XHA5_THATH|nr:hypothetical protein FRX31_002413 [Thalictrum thalictroides]
MEVRWMKALATLEHVVITSTWREVNFSADCLANYTVNLGPDIQENFVGDSQAMIVVEEVLAEFSKYTGLEVNNAKTSLLVGGRSDEASKDLASILNVQSVRPPVTYLGIPLSSTRIGIKDCQPILDKALQRISNWKSRFLSLADGKDTLLWHDIWCDGAPLWNNQIARQEWEGRYPIDSKMDLLITNMRWNDEAMQIQDRNLIEKICSIRINQFTEKDMVVWKPTSIGEFSSKSAYRALKPILHKSSYFGQIETERLPDYEWLCSLWSTERKLYASFL